MFQVFSFLQLLMVKFSNLVVSRMAARTVDFTSRSKYSR